MDSNIKIIAKAVVGKVPGCRFELEFYNVSTGRKTVQQHDLQREELQETAAFWDTDLTKVSQIEDLVCTAVRIYDGYEIVFDKYNESYYKFNDHANKR